jgi:hypothetical protein
MVCGLAEIEVEEWQAHTAYQHCTATTRHLSWFWDVVTAMDQQRRHQLLAFETSSSTLLPGGFTALRRALLQAIAGGQSFDEGGLRSIHSSALTVLLCSICVK